MSSKSVILSIAVFTFAVAISGSAHAQGTVFVEGDNVGIGVANPLSKLHVRGTDGNTQVLVQEQSTTEVARTLIDLQNNGVAYFRVSDTSPDGSGWTFQAEGPSFRFNKAGTGGAEVVIRSRQDATGGLATFAVDGSIQADNVAFTSSRAKKQDLVPVDVRSVLDRVATLEISEWAFKDDGNGRRHVGPMAEDFFRAFDLGGSSSEISLIDASGVAFAAIQGLVEVLEEKNLEIEALNRQNADLEARVAAMEAAVERMQNR